MNGRRSLAAVIASLVPLGLVGGGCSSLGPFDQTVCLTEATGLGDLAPVEGVDFVHLRSQSDISAIDDLGSWGEACKSAPDETKCEADLAAVPFQGGLNATGFDVTTKYELTFTKGGAVGSVQSAADLLALLGPIDTPNEAALVAFANGHEMPCTEENVRKVGDTYVVLATKGSTCGGDVEHYEVTVTKEGTITVGESEIAEHGDPNCAIGRRPSLAIGGVGRCAPLPARGPGAPSAPARRVGAAAGRWFARVAELEAAAIVAFDELVDELRAHDAPMDLVRAAKRSRRDEIRHARTMTSVARRYGGKPSRSTSARRGVRPLVDVARDNATEGCVRETFGALIASVQARRAEEPSVRRALARIAVDETRHAELSWSIHRWALARLPASEQAAIRTSQARALEALRAEVAVDLPVGVQRAAGMPDGETQLLDGLACALGLA